MIDRPHRSHRVRLELQDAALDALLTNSATVVAGRRPVAQHLDSYRRDLRQFGAWLERERGARLLEAQHDDVLAYLAYRFSRKAKASSAGRLLSSLKRFYRFGLRAGLLARDPTLKIDTPKQLPRACPRP